MRGLCFTTSSLGLAQFTLVTQETLSVWKKALIGLGLGDFSLSIPPWSFPSVSPGQDPWSKAIKQAGHSSSSEHCTGGKLPSESLLPFLVAQGQTPPWPIFLRLPWFCLLSWRMEFRDDLTEELQKTGNLCLTLHFPRCSCHRCCWSSQ